MTRQEAIDVIKAFVAYGERVNAFVYKGSTSIPIDALNMSIKALEQEPNLLCALADRECPFQGKEYAWCLTCPHISEEDRALVKKVVLEPKRGEWTFVGDNMFSCNKCGEIYSSYVFMLLRNRDTDPYAPKYCPCCGARMETEQ